MKNKNATDYNLEIIQDRIDGLEIKLDIIIDLLEDLVAKELN